MNMSAVIEALDLIFANRDKILSAGETVWTAAQDIWSVFSASQKAKLSGAAEPAHDSAKLASDIATVKAAVAA